MSGPTNNPATDSAVASKAAGVSLKVPRRKRRWLQMSLRTLLLLLVVGCVWLGWVANRVQQERKAVATIEAAGGAIRYDHEELSVGEFRGWYKKSIGYGVDNTWTFIRDSDSRMGHGGSVTFIEFDGIARFRTAPDPPGPLWARRWLGDDYFRTVVAVLLVDEPAHPAPQPPDDDVVRALTRLPHLRELYLRLPSISDSMYEAIGQITSLQVLDLDRARVTDANLSRLVALNRLEVLKLQVTDVTDAGMVHLGRLQSLKELDLYCTHVSDLGVAQLAKLRNLELLNLRYTAVTDEGLLHLNGLSKLRKVVLTSQRGLTREGAAKLQQALPDARIEWNGVPVAKKWSQ